MRSAHKGLVVAALATCVAGTALAEEERYRLERTDSGYVRLDTRTGDMSICEERTGQLICRAAADERAAFQDEIDRLSEGLAGLEKRMTQLENSAATSSLPSDEEFDRTLGYMERFFRSFMDIVNGYEKNSAPDRT